MEDCDVKRLEESDQFDQSPSPASSGVATPINTSLRPCQRTPPQGRVGPSPSPPVPTSPVVPVPPEPTGHVQLTPCPVCGRTFVPQSLSKHVKICEKMMTKKRKTFDSSRQRREGTDLEQFLPKNFGLPENSPFLEKSPPPSAKIAAAPVKKPTVRSAIKKPAADLQRCPHCSRAFGQRAYERHVEWCQEKAKILPAAPLQTPAHISDAKQRLNARTQYKAPLARGRRSSQSRDKSSNSRSQSVESSRGVSPPARDFDYRKGRCRASESVSSNDHEDSPHVPIIKNTRQSISNLSESNAKARQARLARDLSSSRKSKPSSGDQNHSTDRSKTTPRTIINAKRKNIENIKKIENKYKDREKQNQDLNKLEEKFKYIKSNIPVVTKMVPSKVTSSEKSKNRNSSKANVKEVPVESVDSKVPSKSHKKSLPKQNSKNRNIKESTMSLDSLDEQRTAVEVNPAHEDTDDKLSCVCVPCVINESVIVKSSSKNINKKLPTVTHKIKKDQFVEKEMDDSFQDENSKTVVSNIIKVEPTLVYNNIIEKEVPDAIEQFNKVKEIVTLKESDCSYEEYSDSLDKKYDRNGSGDTYTKHSENLEDLEEFMNLTDNLLQNQERELEENLLADFHTPNTTSMETSSVVETTSDRIAASKTFENLKHDLQQLLLHEKNNAKQDKKSNLISVNIKEICKQEEIAETKSEESADNKSNMEHIQLYEFKSKKEENTNSTHDLKLPSINTNKQRKSKNCINLKRSKQKKNRYTIYEKECISDEESDLKSVSAEVPPLKLPRIDTKRLDDNYDPFLSAARQMKELMSSETNIHKRLYSSTKDINRTLPILRTSKDKISSRPDYTKTMKESMNRSYQRAPSLQRMKSFDSSNHNTISSFGQRCNSFRVNRNDNKSSHKLNTTFTKSSKDNISIPDKNNFNRNNIMNRSFSGYSASCHSTPKPRDKIPKISTSMYHSFQRNTSKQPKTNKVQKNEIKNEIKSNFVNLDCILADDNVSIADSNYIDPRLINETDNLPINVNTILNNPDIISSMESLLTTENLPAKFESFNGNNINGHINKILDNDMKNKLDVETNNNLNLANKKRSKIFDELSNQYDKIMSSLEVSATSKSSLRDDESICEDFDIEEFMTNFDDVVTKQKTDDKRISSSTTRIIKQSELFLDNKDANSNSISNLNKLEKNNSNGSIHYIKSDCLNFSTNNIAETLFPSSIKRSTSLLDSMQKKNVQRVDSSKMRHKVDQLEQDIMQSLKEFDKFYESETQEKNGMHYNGHVMNGNATTKRPRVKSEKTNKMNGDSSHTLNGKSSYDSAYSSLNRISPSKLSISNSKDSNGVESLERIPSRSDTSGHHDMRSVSSDEFLAMERSIEIEPTSNHEDAKMYEKHGDSNRCTDNRSHSRASRPRSPTWPSQPDLHSSSSESSVFKPRKDSLPSPAPRLSRFCHECGQKFPVDTAKFCIECGVKRLLV